jgi:hypothetical protein
MIDRYMLLGFVGLALACLPLMATWAEDPPRAQESALAFVERILAEGDVKGVPWIMGQAATAEVPGRREALEKALGEWIAHRKRFGWRAKAVLEHGDALGKMVVIQESDHIDPVFVVRTTEADPWRLVFLPADEEMLLGTKRVANYRAVFDVLEKQHRTKAP